MWKALELERDIEEGYDITVDLQRQQLFSGFEFL